MNTSSLFSPSSTEGTYSTTRKVDTDSTGEILLIPTTSRPVFVFDNDSVRNFSPDKPSTAASIHSLTSGKVKCSALANPSVQILLLLLYHYLLQ